MHFTCQRAGCKGEKDEAIAKLAHAYEAAITAPTCESPGYTTHTCATCGSSYVDSYTAATDHDYKSEVTKEATCTAEGVLTFTCQHEGCGKTYTQAIPKADHEMTATVTKPTCLSFGYTEYRCQHCDYSYVNAFTQPTGHAWNDGEVTTQPTIWETGVMTYTCENCGETRTEELAELPACEGGVYCPSAGFTDVPGANNWAHAGIDYCVSNGLMYGVGGSRFAPQTATTRAQIVQILYSLSGSPSVSGAAPFTDLTQDWYKNAVRWAYQTGVVSGMSATTFAPNAPVTREQIAVILMGYAQKVLGVSRTWTPADLSRYPDASRVSAWAHNALADTVSLGLISGTLRGGQAYLDPQGSATREQVATILMQFCKNVKP